MKFLSNPTGRKIVMSATGLMMISFVIIHLAGNFFFFKGAQGINAYADFLHSLGPLLWTTRAIMLAAICVHGFFGIRLYLENRKARPGKYAVRKELSTTLAGKSMIWTGLLIAFYLIYHLLHFTLQMVYPETSAMRNPDATGRPDVYLMMALSFHKSAVVAVYLGGMAGLALHLGHGIQSMFQTTGLNSEKSLPLMIRISALAAFLMFLGYMSIPVSIITGMAGK